jgi:hypothetical protein
MKKEVSGRNFNWWNEYSGRIRRNRKESFESELSKTEEQTFNTLWGYFNGDEIDFKSHWKKY